MLWTKVVGWMIMFIIVTSIPSRSAPDERKAGGWGVTTATPHEDTIEPGRGRDPEAHRGGPTMTLDIRGAATEALDRRDWTDPRVEPSLAEILSDPMMELLFRRDHLHRDNVEHFLRDHASRLADKSL